MQGKQVVLQLEHYEAMLSEFQALANAQSELIALLMGSPNEVPVGKMESLLFASRMRLNKYIEKVKEWNQADELIRTGNFQKSGQAGTAGQHRGADGKDGHAVGSEAKGL